jgi:hypothetical protein
MRKFKDLAAEEFPGVVPEQFDQWKQKRLRADNIFGITYFIVALTGLILTVFFKIGFVWVLLFLAAPMILRPLILGPVSRFASEIGINEVDIQSALKK